MPSADRLSASDSGRRHGARVAAGVARRGLRRGRELQHATSEGVEEGAPEWRLLLQLDSDEAVDVMWGDVGTLYFWIRESDARAARFDRTWLILQCH